MILKVKDELVEIYLEYDDRSNIDIKVRKVADRKIYAYVVGFFEKHTGIFHRIGSIEDSGLPMDKEGLLKIGT